MIFISLSILIYLLGNHGVHSQDECVLDVTNFGNPPLVLSSQQKFLYPSLEGSVDFNNRVVKIEKGDSFIIACPGTNIDSLSVPDVVALCTGDSNVFIEDPATTANFYDLGCTRAVSSSIIETQGYCAPNAKTINVGFQLSSSFVTLATICFDYLLKNPVYATYTITKALAFIEDDYPTREIEDPVYDLDISMASVYTAENEIRTINHQLGLPADSNKYIPSGGFWHKKLADEYRDFVYYSQKVAVMRFINNWAQWPTVEDVGYFNYNYYLDDIEYYVKDNEVDIEIYVGTYGISTLPHETTGRNTELYLYLGNDNVTAVPVPAMTWKMLYRPETREAIVLLALNPNDYMTQSEVDDLIICDDVAEETNWRLENYDNIYYGYAYACEYETFIAALPYEFPELQVDGMLYKN